MINIYLDQIVRKVKGMKLKLSERKNSRDRIIKGARMYEMSDY